MEIKRWRYYNHAAIPAAPPHEEPDMLLVENGDIWKLGGLLYWHDGRQTLIAAMRQISGM